MACRLLYGTHMVTIEVGAEKEHFVVHQSLLCTKSPYFDKALSGSFQEAITRFIRLPDISPVLFRIFVAWLYHGNLGYSPRIGKTIGEDFESLEITEEELQHEAAHQPKSQDVLNNDTESIDSDDVNPNKNVVTEPAYDITVAERSQQQTSSTSDINDGSLSIVELEYQEDDPRTWSYEVLVKLYVLADRFDIRELRADSLDALGHATQNKSALCHSMVVRYIYMNTPSGSKLRQYIVHCAAYGLDFSEGVSIWLTYPLEFLAAVMVTNGRRLPIKQCCDCYHAALEMAPVLGSDEDDERDSEEDSPPYKRDMCFYHEHPDEEEREACRLRREDPESDD
jgi:hypothetical protein